MRKKFLLVAGGTGGHVLPAENLANYLLSKNIECSLILDKRGGRFVNYFKGRVYIINSSTLGGNLINKIIGLLNLILGFFQSIFIIILWRPNSVISFGSYASFVPVLSCILLKPFLKIDIFIHEQNSVLGRTNGLFLKFANKLFLNFDISSKIIQKYINKTHVVGSPEKNNLKNYSKKNINDKFTISFFGGSQGSEFISNFSVNLIKSIDNENTINVKYIIQCPEKKINKISNQLSHIKSEIIIKNYFTDIDNILQKTSIIVSRAGAGSINDIINYKIPSILVPLPSAKDNHQALNALILEKHEVAIIIDQNKNELDRVKDYIYEIYRNFNKMNLINQRFDKIKVRNSNSLIYRLILNEKN